MNIEQIDAELAQNKARYLKIKQKRSELCNAINKAEGTQWESGYLTDERAVTMAELKSNKAEWFALKGQRRAIQNPEVAETEKQGAWGKYLDFCGRVAQGIELR